MKLYQTQVFLKSGIKVNAVYIVKPGDTLSGIQKTVKRLGGDPKDLVRLEPAIEKGLAPGQFVYFHSDLPRESHSVDKILHTHEIERCSFQLLTINNKTNFKETLDEYGGFKNAWIEILAANRLSASDFKNESPVQVKIYHPKQVFSKTVYHNTVKVSSLDSELAKLRDGRDSVVTQATTRTPAAAPEEQHSKANDGLVYGGLIVMVVLFVLSYRKNKKKIALDIPDL